MPLVLQMHPKAHLQNNLQDSHYQQQNDGKGSVDASCGYSRERDQCQYGGENKHYDMPLRPLLPVAVLHTALLRMLFRYHGFSPPFQAGIQR
ncbi:hypothetical protein D3C74_437300 [compost metagenome]